MELLVGVDVFFKDLPMPNGIKGFVRESQGIYYVYVNSNLPKEETIRTIKHEYYHLINNDFYNQDSVDVIERRNK